jgi:hypothetical protein
VYKFCCIFNSLKLISDAVMRIMSSASVCYFSSYLLFNNLEVMVYKILNFPVDLYASKMCSFVTLKEEHKLPEE